MKNYIFCLLLFMLCAVSLFSQTSLGWSRDGRIIAFASYDLGFEADSGKLTLIIQNLYNDEVLFHDDKTWDSEYNYRTGESNDVNVPNHLEEALSVYTSENPAFNADMNRYGIILSKSTMDEFPLRLNEDAYRLTSADSVPYKEGNANPLVIQSDNLGRKSITDLARKPRHTQGGYHQVVGYLLNPVKDRIAVVVKWGLNGFYKDYSLYGCHLFAGFDPNAFPEYSPQRFEGSNK